MAATAGLVAGATLPAMGAMRAVAGTTAQQEQFTNPVIWQDFADLEVIRVGDTYYYTGSSGSPLACARAWKASWPCGGGPARMTSSTSRCRTCAASTRRSTCCIRGD